MAVNNSNTYQGDMLLSMLGWQGKTRAELNEEIAGVKVPDPEDILSPKKGLNGEKSLTEKQKVINDMGEKLQRICHKMLWYDMLNNEIRVGYAELVKPERVIKFHESMPRLYEIEALDMYFGRRKAVKWMHEYDCVLKTSIMGNFTSKGIIHGVKHSIIEKKYELFTKLVNKGFEDFLLPLFKIENAPDVYEQRMCLPIRGKWKREKMCISEEVEELLKIGREEKFKIFKDYLLQHNLHIQVDNLGKPWGENKYYIFSLGR